MITRRSLQIALSLALVLLCAAAAAQVSPPASAAPPTEGQKLVAQGKFAEGLAALDQELKADQQNSALQLSRVDALMGLHRYKEAAPLALRMGSSGPEFRYKAGVCALEMGLPASAVQMWSPLCQDPQWAPTAYWASVKALLAQGKEKEAKELLAKALSALPSPSLALVRLAYDLGVGLDLAKPALAKLAGGDPAAAEFQKLCAAGGGGPFYEESLSKALPVVVAVKEKSEEVQMSSLQWGGGTYSLQTPAAAGSTAVSSSSQGYGAGMSGAGASSEGGKTGTMSTLRRVVVPASINGGREEAMVLSSQTDQVFVSAGAVKRLGLTAVARGEYLGLGTSAKVPCDRVVLKQLTVGGVTFRNVPANVIDERTDYWKETGGIVPFWLLRHYTVDYERREGKLTLYPPGTSPESLLGPGSFRVRSVWWNGAPYVETEIQGKPGCFLLMDISLPSTYLSASHLDDLGLTVNVPRYGHRQEVGLFGYYSYDVAEHASLGLGPATVDLAAVRVATPSAVLAVNACGALGRETLDLFQMVLDYSSGVASFKGFGK